MAAAGVSWADITSYIPLLLDGGVAGVWIICWLKGWIVSSREVDHVTEERDAWKALYVQERDAHEKTREALHLASERGESTTEALQLVAGIMNAVRVQAGHENLPEAARAQVNRGTRASPGSHRAVRPPSRE